MENCVFCKIISKSIPSTKIFENDLFYAFLDINPVNEGHTLLIPKKHTDYFFDLPTEEYNSILKIAKQIEPALKKATSARRIGLIVEGFAVPHAHLHMVPIHNGNELDPNRAKKATLEELKNIQEKIIKEMK